MALQFPRQRSLLLQPPLQLHQLQISIAGQPPAEQPERQGQPSHFLRYGAGSALLRIRELPALRHHG